MGGKGGSICALAAAGLLLAAGAGPCAENDVNALKGLGQGICVALGEEDSEARRVGLGAATLAEAVRESLRKLGVPLAEGARACLQADVRLRPIRGAGIVSYAVQLSLVDDYQLARTSGATLRGPVWKSLALGNSLGAQAAQDVRGTLEGAVQAFASDYQFVNAPQGAGSKGP